MFIIYTIYVIYDITYRFYISIYISKVACGQHLSPPLRAWGWWGAPWRELAQRPGLSAPPAAAGGQTQQRAPRTEDRGWGAEHGQCRLPLAHPPPDTRPTTEGHRSDHSAVPRKLTTWAVWSSSPDGVITSFE